MLTDSVLKASAIQVRCYQPHQRPFFREVPNRTIWETVGDVPQRPDTVASHDRRHRMLLTQIAVDYHGKRKRASARMACLPRVGSPSGDL